MATPTTTIIPSTPARLAPTHLIGGAGGLLFVTMVVVQNLLRAAAPPANATAHQVAGYYADHQPTSAVVAVLFVLSGTGLLCFAAGIADRLLGAARGPAIIGLLGISGVFCLFSTMLATDLAEARLVAAGVRGDALETAWVIHQAAFCVLLFAIAAALAGLSAAATATGLVGPAWRPAGAIGALLLAVAAAASPVVLDGGVVLYVGVGGFAVWLAFVARSAAALLRSPVSSRARRTTA
jgi:hypothetical protein